MAQNLITSVRREINRLQKEINHRSSQLAALKHDLIKHQRIYRLLGGTDRAARRPRRTQRGARRAVPVDWNLVLQGLPSRFTVGDLSKHDQAKRKSPVYLCQTLVRWAKQGKTKRVERGKYQKVEPTKSPAAARRLRK